MWAEAVRAGNAHPDGNRGIAEQVKDKPQKTVKGKK